MGGSATGHYDYRTERFELPVDTRSNLIEASKLEGQKLREICYR